MCQTCYDKGFKDYPSFNGSIEHIEFYKRGYKTRQLEVTSTDPDELQHTFFCEKCYDRGLTNGKNGVWAPPLSTKRGHYESYEKGYNNVEIVEDEKVPEYIQHDENKPVPAFPSPGKMIMLLSFWAIIVVGALVFVVFKITTSKTDLSATVKTAVRRDSSNVINSLPDSLRNTQKDTTQFIKKDTIVEMKQALPTATASVTPVEVKTPPSAVSKLEVQKLPPTNNRKEDTGRVKLTETPKTLAPMSNAKLSDYANKILNEADLKGLTKYQLRFIRNEIYARHGMIFQSKDLVDYFSKQSWYKPRVTNVNGLLSVEERQNVELIKRLER